LLFREGGWFLRKTGETRLGRFDDDDDDDDLDLLKNSKKNSQPLLLPLRDELPAMALLTLLYAIQGIPLGLTMGSV